MFAPQVRNSTLLQCLTHIVLQDSHKHVYKILTSDHFVEMQRLGRMDFLSTAIDYHIGQRRRSLNERHEKEFKNKKVSLIKRVVKRWQALRSVCGGTTFR